MSYFANPLDKMGNFPIYDAAGQTPVSDMWRLCGATFGSAIDTNFWTATTSGAGSSASVSAGKASCVSGTANSGYGQILSSVNSRFIFGHPQRFRGIFRLTATSVANNTRRWGAFSVSTNTPQNGVYFEVSAAGALSVNCVSGGSVSTVASGAFNGSVASYTMDTNAHAYEIFYFTASAKFVIDGVLIHTFVPTTAVLYQDLNAPISFASINSAGGTTSGTLECWNATILRLGLDVTVGQFRSIAGAQTVTMKTGPGTLQKIVINANAGSSITVYDNTAGSGTQIAAIVPNQICTLDYDAPFTTGLTIVSVGAGCAFTVVYE